MSCPVSPRRTNPHRRYKPGYKSPSTHRHSKARYKNYRLQIENFETLNEWYGMDTKHEQFVCQNFYHQFVKMSESGESLWRKIYLDKKRIIWKNPMNGIAIAQLKDIDFEISLPNSLPSFQDNYLKFKSLWMALDHNIDLLYENIENHIRNNEYCCLNCHFPFATVCAELYTQFDPDPPPLPVP